MADNAGGAGERRLVWLTPDGVEFVRHNDIALAQYLVRVHCQVSWPEGLRCNNCMVSHPCVSHRWAVRVLTAAGWCQEQIAALDQRSGPWF